nr:MAG TPA: hypothetical protein [Caudoviricetes sp.]
MHGANVGISSVFAPFFFMQANTLRRGYVLTLGKTTLPFVCKSRLRASMHLCRGKT